MTTFARVASLFAGAVLFISACDRAADITVPQARVSTAAPASLIAAEPLFFFLRPIARRTNFTGEFDATLSPVVEICEWRANACALPLVSRLTNVKLRGADSDDDADDAQVEAEPNAHYGVKWRTRGLNLDPAKMYRIRVLVSGTELGVADVDVVRNAREAKGVDRSLFVPLVAGKNLKIRFRIEKGAVTVIGAGGGTISALGGLVLLDIPAGALPGDVGFTFKQTIGPPQPGGFVVPGSTIEFGPEGIVFARPVKLTLRYDDAGLTPAVESSLRLQKVIAGRWALVPGSTVDVSANTVSGMIGGFSTYGVVTWSGTMPMFSGMGTATVDGILDPAEWAPSASLDFSVNLPSGDTTHGTFYVMNDGTNLYLAVAIARMVADPKTQIQFTFDNDNDNVLEDGDDRLELVAHPALSFFADGWWQLTPPCPAASACAAVDALSTGTHDGSAAFANDGVLSVIEIVHPLNSADDPHDFSLALDDIVGFNFILNIYDAASNYASTWFPAPIWGKILIASSAPPPPPALQFDSGSVTAGLNHSCAIAIPDASYCWGANAYGALGNNTTTLSNVPVPVWGGHSFRTLSAGSAVAPFLGAHTCGLDGGGRAYCWGLNNYGQLGNGLTFSEDTAHPVAAFETFKSISAGRMYTCAVIINGTAVCWGGGNFGQLGNGKQAMSLLPDTVKGGLTFEMISAGDLHTCGVTTTGDVYCWGNNGDGQLGLGTQSPPHLVPQFVIGGFNWVSAGADHTCGVHNSGQVYCWGANHYGQLGDGTQIIRLSPVAVGGGLGTGYKRVDVGGRSGSLTPDAHTCGVKFTGEAFCWGGNGAGQLGNGGSAIAYVFPSQVMGGHLFRNVSAGVDHSCGVTFMSETYCWGSPLYGGLGNGGAPAPFATPVLVSGGFVFH